MLEDDWHKPTYAISTFDVIVTTPPLPIYCCAVFGELAESTAHVVHQAYSTAEYGLMLVGLHSLVRSRELHCKNIYFVSAIVDENMSATMPQIFKPASPAGAMVAR